MRRFIAQVAATLGAGLLATVAAGQGVYESKGEGGVPVFSDRPTPGATRLNLPAPNVSSAPRMTVEPLAEPPPPPYTALRIVKPESQGTVFSNEPEFDVVVQVEPPLDAARGDVIVLKLDGNRLAGEYRSRQIAVSTAQFVAAGADVVLHRLEAAVFNSAGKPRIVSDPVEFYIRRTIVRHRGRR